MHGYGTCKMLFFVLEMFSSFVAYTVRLSTYFSLDPVTTTNSLLRLIYKF